MDFEIDPFVKKLISRLEKKGHTAYLVGGCVRDLLLQKEPKDWDITTSAFPEELVRIFDEFKIIPSGKKHGTVSLIKNRKVYEITTFRVPINDQLKKPSIETDLKARDFTINSLAYSPNGGLVDPNSGKLDLKKRIVKAVGNPDMRFKEDPLRLLRAIRFSSSLEFEIEDKTKKSILKNAKLLKKVSVERIRDEFNQIICGDINYIRLLLDLKLLEQFIPEFIPEIGCEQCNPHHYLDVGEHTLVSMNVIEPDLVLRLAMFFHDIGKPATKSRDRNGVDHFYNHTVVGAEITDKILKKLHYPSNIRKRVVLAVRYHDMDIKLSEKNVRKAISKVGMDNFPLLLKIKRADARAQSIYYLNDKLRKIDEIDKIYINVIKDNVALKIKDLAINGNDLLGIGFDSGKRVGEVLKAILDIVIDDPSKNKRELLLEIATIMAKEEY